MLPSASRATSAASSKSCISAPAAWQRLPYSTELSPFYSQELVDIGREQIVQEQAQAKAWFEQALTAHACATARFPDHRGLSRDRS